MKTIIFTLFAFFAIIHLTNAQQTYPNPNKELKAEKKAIKKAEKERKKERIREDKGNVKYHKKREVIDYGDQVDERLEERGTREAKTKEAGDKKRPESTPSQK